MRKKLFFRLLGKGQGQPHNHDIIITADLSKIVRQVGCGKCGLLMQKERNEEHSRNYRISPSRKKGSTSGRLESINR